MSKFLLDVLERCVFFFTASNDPDVILGAAGSREPPCTHVARVGESLSSRG